jgi:hypothetical protein
MRVSPTNLCKPELPLTSDHKLPQLVTLLGLLLLAGAVPCCAQETAPQYSIKTVGTNGIDSAATLVPAPTDQPPAGDTEPASPASSAPPANSAADSSWHLAVSPYLWLPGVHGTIGGLGRDASISASPGDLLSHFRFGLMGVVEARYKRIVLPLDLMWVRLEDDKALPVPLKTIAANVKASEFILSPQIGFRLVDQKQLKIDALTGFRYWHLGQNLQFTPSALGLSFSGSQNWVDPLVGGHIQVALSPKIEAIIAGDVGGWGTGSQLDYQVVGVLGYRIKPALVLQAGYRYLYVNYRSGGAIFDVATSGVILGATISLK